MQQLQQLLAQKFRHITHGPRIRRCLHHQPVSTLGLATPPVIPRCWLLGLVLQAAQRLAGYLTLPAVVLQSCNT
jgi:hypothetical protein